jgi:hypothetical protein
MLLLFVVILWVCESYLSLCCRHFDVISSLSVDIVPVFCYYLLRLVAIPCYFDFLLLLFAVILCYSGVILTLFAVVRRYYQLVLLCVVICR